MCGRFSAAGKLSELAKFIDFVIQAPSQVVRYNIAPRQTVPVLVAENRRPTLKPLRWGLIPAWSKDEKIADQLINARSETIFNKPSFRTAIQRRRCLIPADGFYEWQRSPDGLVPIRFTQTDGGYFAFAGIWDTWHLPPVTGEFDFGEAFRPAATTLETFSILTTSANAVVAPIHDRMPVIIPPAHYAAWLDHGAFDQAYLQTLLTPWPAEATRATRVSNQVNNVRNDSPACIAPV